MDLFEALQRDPEYGRHLLSVVPRPGPAGLSGHVSGCSQLDDVMTRMIFCSSNYVLIMR
jgi:hypothetical protein